MKAVSYILLLQFTFSSLLAQQFYLRGEVKDETGFLLQNVKIVLQSSGFVYRTGNYGSFGISSAKQFDTLFFSLDGYISEKLAVKAGFYFNMVLERKPVASTNIKKDKLLSLTKNVEGKEFRNWIPVEETYASLIENSFVKTENYPSTGIALNVDRASYSNVRRFINLGMAVPPDAVRIEEMLNNFNFDYQAPDLNSLFKIKATTTTCPWNAESQLLFLNIFSKQVDFDTLPSAHLIFLIDVSGSMDMPNRLPLIQSAFKNLVAQLREKDTVSIVVYGGATGVLLLPTGGCEKQKINKIIDELSPGGSTPGASGIRLAYTLAKNYFIEGGNNRIIMATDGDFNVGLKTEKELEELIMQHRENGIYLTALGVGMGNYKDSRIQMLARTGNGNFAYLDNYYEADKILLKEFAQTLYTVADDVFMTLQFNPSIVSAYRLIGFDNKAAAMVDSLSIIDGGEIGSGYSLTIAFEIQTNSSIDQKKIAEDLFQVKLNYHIPMDTVRQELNMNFKYDLIPFAKLNANYRLATAVIMFGSLLKSSEYIKEATWGDVLFQASEAANPTDLNQSQFVELVYKARALYGKIKKKKRAS